jgi:hypothetical protein
MDYETLITEGNDERRAVLERLDARLLKLSTTSQLERSAKEAQDLKHSFKIPPTRILGYRIIIGPYGPLLLLETPFICFCFIFRLFPFLYRKLKVLFYFLFR